MPSFDIVSQVDRQEVRNAVEQANKEVTNRFDFKGSDARVELSELVLTGNADARCLEPGGVERISGDKVKRPLTVRVGIAQDRAKSMVKLIKDSKLKLSASIQGDAVRVAGAKKDDLQAAIQLVRKSVTDLPLQFINLRD